MCFCSVMHHAAGLSYRYSVEALETAITQSNAFMRVGQSPKSERTCRATRRQLASPGFSFSSMIVVTTCVHRPLFCPSRPNLAATRILIFFASCGHAIFFFAASCDGAASLTFFPFPFQRSAPRSRKLLCTALRSPVRGCPALPCKSAEASLEIAKS